MKQNKLGELNPPGTCKTEQKFSTTDICAFETITRAKSQISDFCRKTCQRAVA